MSIKVLIADDHEMVRRGLVNLLSGTDIKIVAEACDGAEAAKLTAKHRPDVVLLDVRMPEVDGLDALERIHREDPSARVVMLSTYENPTYVARAVALGATDYVLKGASRQEILSVIRSAAEGKSPSPAGELGRVAGSMSKAAVLDADEEEITLTTREKQVLRHVALGLSNKEIGQSLSISVETVKEHVQNILRKIAATDRTQAAVWAVKKGIV